MSQERDGLARAARATFTAWCRGSEAEMSAAMAELARAMAVDPAERPWGQIPAGWEVQAPSGDWYRIISNVQRDGKQYVYLDMGNGEGREWPRNPADRVTCRPPANPDATDAALSAFGDGFEILGDQELEGLG